ncbi:hypothetical protein G5V59_27105 [Nocardioides sp. W3-2-3]|uniref:hypothetical protein n=1 Tax=Nocardioides convexus TaxID=2712224 RepID=UPI0024183620|nr:hypothetical protein [Nocardioides convexus]NHA02062.1 hypothetical protein [Nocardioides convexus]
MLRTWLDDVFDAAEPFMSQSDILGGTRPLQRIEDELAGARFGVIIVTAANQHAPWITFEAGALSKVIDDAVQYVMPMLVDLRISDLTGPLTQFQAAVLDAAGVKKMVTSIGHALGMDKAIVERKFDTFWPQARRRAAGDPRGHRQRGAAGTRPRGGRRRDPDPRPRPTPGSRRRLLVEA